MPQIDDNILVSQLQDAQQKDKAFQLLVDQYKQRLYWHIRKLVYNHDDADDVLQNTFVKVYKNIKGFKGESKLFSWLYRIATNEAITFLNKKAKMQQVSIEDYQQQMASSLQEDSLYDGDRIQLLLQQAIATLPQKQQLVFNLKYFEELKYDEISEILDTSVGALKASYHHAVKKIEAFIKQH